MNAKERRKLRRKDCELAKRLDRNNGSRDNGPVFKTTNVKYEVSEKASAVRVGGVAAAHVLAKKVGLARAIDERLHLLKIHAPYHESDHVLNIAYVMLAGGDKLEDLEMLREDEAYMNVLGARRIPDPTTAGDFLRRFDAMDIVTLMELVNGIRVRLWLAQSKEFRGLVLVIVRGFVIVLDEDGTADSTKTPRTAEPRSCVRSNPNLTRVGLDAGRLQLEVRTGTERGGVHPREATWSPISDDVAVLCVFGRITSPPSR